MEISVVTIIDASRCAGNVMEMMTVEITLMSTTAVLVSAQKVNTVVTICVAFLHDGSATTMTTVKTIPMNVTVS